MRLVSGSGLLIVLTLGFSGDMGAAGIESAIAQRVSESRMTIGEPAGRDAIRIVSPGHGETIEGLETSIAIEVDETAVPASLRVRLNGQEITPLLEETATGRLEATVSVADHARYGKNSLTVVARQEGRRPHFRRIAFETVTFQIRAPAYTPPQPDIRWIITREGQFEPRFDSDGYIVTLDRISFGSGGSPNYFSKDAQLPPGWDLCKSLLWLLVLDREALDEKDSRIFAPCIDRGQSMLAFVASLTVDDLVILNDVSVPDDDREPYLSQNVEEAIVLLGGLPVEALRFAETEAYFSMVGWRGLTPGQAYMSVATVAEEANATGPLASGMMLMLARDSHGRLAPTSTEHPEFDLHAESGPTSNVIIVGGRSFTAPPPSSDVGGFHVLVLDRGTLDRPEHQTFWTRQSNNDAAQAIQVDMAEFLEANDDPGRLLLVASINGALNEAPVNELVQAMQSVGATAFTFSSLRADDSYALIGQGAACNHDSPVSPGCVVRGQEVMCHDKSLSNGCTKIVDEQAQPAPARIRGVLARQPFGFYFWPIDTDLRGNANLELYRLISQPPSPWPHPSTPAENAAWTCISQQWNPNVTDIRTTYPDEGITDLTNVKTAVNKAVITSSFCAGVDQGAFDTIQTYLGGPAGEIQDAINVRGYLDSSSGHLADTMKSGENNFRDALGVAAEHVLQAIEPEQDTASVAFEGIFNTVLKVAGSVAPLSEVKAALGVTSALMNFASKISSLDDGTPTAVLRIKAEEQTLKDGLQNALDQTLDQLEVFSDMIYYDYDRLHAMGAGIADTSNTSPWYWDADVTTQALDAYTQAAYQTIYEALMAIPYGVLELQNIDDDNPDHYRCRGPRGLLYNLVRGAPQTSYNAIPIAGGRYDIPVILAWPPDCGPIGDSGVDSSLWDRLTAKPITISTSNGVSFDPNHLGIPIPIILEKWRLPRKRCDAKDSVYGDNCTDVFEASEP